MTIIAQCAIIVNGYFIINERNISKMSDIYSKKERSAIMSKIRSKNNKSTELKLIAYFKLMELKVGVEIIKSKENPTSFSWIKKLPFLWMVVFGTDTIAEI